MRVKTLLILIYAVFIFSPLAGQLKIGSVRSEINFREGPGTNFRVLHTINNSNLLVILPREPQNGFIEVFDVETSSRGYVYETLIQVTDTLDSQTQKYFEKSGDRPEGDIEIILINRTNNPLFVWINKNSYDLAPHEKKILILDMEEITYFSSVPGFFPVFGREILQKGNSYIWNFSQ